MTEQFILDQSEETKIKWLNQLLEEQNFGAWLELTKILLKHPIHKGGIQTDIIDDIFKRHNK